MVRESAVTHIQKLTQDVLGGGERKGRWGATVTWGLLILIVLNVVAFVLGSVEPIANRYGSWFDYILYVSIALFTLEYVLRVWACTLDDSGLYGHPLRGRLRYMLTPLSLIDLAVILPFFVGSLAGLAKEVVFHKGDEAHSMFFIVSGELEVELQPKPLRMKRGDFFGEVALVYHRRRTASIVSLSRSELLELKAQDLNRLFESKPEFRSRILEEAQRRLSRGHLSRRKNPCPSPPGMRTKIGA